MNNDNDHSGIIILVTIILSITLFIKAFKAHDFLLGVLFIALSIVVFVLGLIIWGTVVDKINLKSKIKDEERDNAVKDSIKEGSYRFPCKAFYEKCLANGIVHISNSYEKSKAALLVLETIKENIHLIRLTLTEADCTIYINNCEKLFSEGQCEFSESQRKKEEKNKFPKNGQYEIKDKSQVEFHEKFSNYNKSSPKSKRDAILNSNLKELNIKIDQIKQARESMLTTAAIVKSSYSSKKTGDIAFLSGVANGIAGPGAAAMTAVNVAAQNAQIEAENRANQAAAKQLSDTFVRSSISADAEERRCKTNIELCKAELKKLQTKVVFNEEIDYFGKLQFAAPQFTFHDKSIHIEVRVKNNYKPDVPEGVRCCIDGSVFATIYCDDKTQIKKVHLALPLYGIECGKEETLIFASDRYMEGSHSNYRVKFEAGELWLMEI